jgi:hypothetical protein
MLVLLRGSDTQARRHSRPRREPEPEQMVSSDNVVRIILVIYGGYGCTVASPRALKRVSAVTAAQHAHAADAVPAARSRPFCVVQSTQTCSRSLWGAADAQRVGPRKSNPCHLLSLMRYNGE